nr:hypothetical protein BaRGS_014999 [Batillaria attramentaria]
MKGVEYEYVPVHLVNDGGEQYKEEYKGKNPMSQVPTLLIDGLTLTQSLPAIEYIDETRPGPAILPKDPKLRAQARTLAELINSGIQPLQNLSVLKVMGDNTANWAHSVITKGFDAFEKMVQKSAGTYCVGDEVTIADLCLIPQIANANRFKVDMSKYPTIVRIKEALETLPAFVAADSKRQPDTPEDQRA